MLASLAALVLAPGALCSYLTTQSFSPAQSCPTCASSNYTGMSNGSLPVVPVVPGKAYDRFISIWLENTDFSAAQADPNFQTFTKQAILLTNYNGVTHPSEPNYVACNTGDFWGMGDDNFYALPSNVSTMVDVLEEKNVSWATYQENMPTDGFSGDYAQTNYLNASAGSYTYYKRKHNPYIILDSIASVPQRALRVRNFNDFGADVNASALPQHVFITPNLVNDAHDTGVTFAGQWLASWLTPLLSNPNFNSNRTLIQVTFDENENYAVQNTVYTLLLGGAVPTNLQGTNDSTFYTHYSMMSSVQNNWGLKSLGRGDANTTLASVWAFQAAITNYTNANVTADMIPQLNLTGIFPGPANTEMWTPPPPPPNANSMGAGGAGVWFNASITSNSTTPAPVNLTAMNAVNPYSINPNYTYAGVSIVNSSSPAAQSASAAANGSAATSSAAASGKSSGVKSINMVPIAVGGAGAMIGALFLLL